MLNQIVAAPHSHPRERPVAVQCHLEISSTELTMPQMDCDQTQRRWARELPEPGIRSHPRSIRNNVDSYPAVKAHPPTNGIPKKSDRGNNQLAQKAKWRP